MGKAGNGRGIGVASCWYGCGNTALPNPSTIRIGITATGAVVLHQGATDIGQGSNTVIAQIAADAVGLPVHAFRLIGPDTGDPGCRENQRQPADLCHRQGRRKAGRSLRATILRLANAGQGA